MGVDVEQTVQVRVKIPSSLNPLSEVGLVAWFISFLQDENAEDAEAISLLYSDLNVSEAFFFT